MELCGDTTAFEEAASRQLATESEAAGAASSNGGELPKNEDSTGRAQSTAAKTSPADTHRSKSPSGSSHAKDDGRNYLPSLE